VKEFGGFVAREDMIFINRSGAIKVWMNENLAEVEAEFPHPTISEEEFISSLLHQIFTRVASPSPSDCLVFYMYEHLKSGQVTFDEILYKLRTFISQNNLATDLNISKSVFDKIFKEYEKKPKATNFCSDANVEEEDETMTQKVLKFVVAEGELENSCSFVKDYSKKRMYEGDSSRRTQDSNLSRSSAVNSSLISLSRPCYVLINESFSA
jgi:hypothetical protein